MQILVKELSGNIPAESLNQADFTLSDWFEGIGANDAAGDCSQAADAFAKAVDYEILADEPEHQGMVALTHRSIPSMGIWIVLVVLDLLGIAWLQVLDSGRLHLHQTARW